MSQHSYIDPPQRALRFFQWYCRPDRLEELEGDLREMHDKRQQQQISKLSLQLRFWWDVIRCFKLYSVKKTQLGMNLSLYRSYFTVALRNSRKNAGPVLINIAGMGLALGFCITVYMLHAFNLEFDINHQDTDDIYRLHSIRLYNDEERRFELAPIPYVSKLENDVANIDEVTYYEANRGTIQVGDEYFSEYIASARDNFFDMFPLDLKYGSPEGLENPTAIYLTQEITEKYFGSESPIGKRLTMFIGKEEGIELQVAGVFKPIPLNNSFDFNVFVNHEAIMQALNTTTTSWHEESNVAIYFRSQNPDAVKETLQGFIPDQNANQENWKVSRFDVWSFMDDRYTEDNVAYSPANERITKSAVAVFTALAILILAVACFNLANTSMALMSRRVKEIGIRKTLGTSNRQLFIQFMLETLITSFLAFVLAILLTDVIGEQIWGLFGASFFLKDISIIRFMPFLVGFLLFCTFLAGVLPAMYAWRFSPTSMLNSGKSLKGVSGLQKVLTVGQYAVSICLLVSAWVFSKNSDYFGTIDLHYNYKDIVMIPLDGPKDYEVFKNELDQLSNAIEVVGTTGHHGISRTRAAFNTDSIDIEVASFHISPEYLPTMEIELKSGRNFIANSQAEQEKSIIVNEEFAKRYLSEIDPFQFKVSLNGEKKNIVGISKDIIHEIYFDYKPTPMVYFPASVEQYDLVLAKTAEGNTDELEKEIQAIWAGLFDTPYRGKPQSHVSSFYATRDARNLKLIFSSIAVLGSMLSLIGIFSLAALNVTKRLKEISIRRVLGATINQVMLIINKSFIVMLAVALLVGVAGGLLLSEAVLQMIYKFYLSGSIVDSIGIGLLVVLVATIFISLAAIRPVLANPSEGLRDE